MIGKNGFTGAYELQYQPLDYYKSMSTCTVEKTRLQRKPEKGITYICLKVDYD
jgi:hypothetical protein